MKAHRWQALLHATDPVRRTGRVRAVWPTHLVADGPHVPLGAICAIEGGGLAGMLAQVVRIDRDQIVLAPFANDVAAEAGAEVVALGRRDDVIVGDALLGRAIDALGRPIDGGPSLADETRWPLMGRLPAPLDRSSPATVLETGIRAIDGLLTLGVGQRVGIFAASGVGKTSLVGQLARQVKADVTVLALIGERGREVEALWRAELDDDARARTLLVAATSDEAPTMRTRAASYALAAAEHWRAQGKHVLLLVDSITRLAMAMREIGLAAGEPPTIRAYTPSVFAAVPRLVERAGAVREGGAITALMTVLSEGDEIDDPLSEMMKSLLDGHVMLSRTLAEQGHFPAIDVSRSVSRQARGLVRSEHRRSAGAVSEMIAVHESSRTLREAGLYAKGADARIDRAIARHDGITCFLRQRTDERSPVDETMAALAALAEGPLA